MTIGGITVFARSFDALMHLFVAYLFGTSDVLDAFLIAYLVPFFAVNVISGAFHAAIIPTYIQVYEKSGRQKANHLYSNILIISAALLVAVMIVMAMLARYILPVLGSGFDESKLAYTYTLFYILLPVLFFNGISRIWASILNAGEHFKLAALVPAVRSAIVIILLFFFAPYWGIYAFAIGIILGSIAETGVLCWGIKKQELDIIPRWQKRNEEMVTVIKQFLPMAAGAVIMAGTDLIDQSMAAMLGPGSVSTLNYANKIIMFFLVVGSGALGTAVFPYFAKMTAINDYGSALHTLKVYASLIVVVCVPITVMFCFFSKPLVQILFERGVFTLSDTHNVAAVLSLYSLQITFYLLGILLVRLLSAMKENGILMYSAMLSLPANICFNYVFMQYIGVAGIALSTACVYFLAFVFLFYSLRMKIKSVMV
jgi:putative peptidoglycan lipid II flippase